MLHKRAIIFQTLLLTLLAGSAFGRTDKFRVIWQGNASTSATVAWNQVSGADPVLLLDVNDFGKNADEYGLSKRPDRIQMAEDMNNHFVRLVNLLPNMTYYFLVKDSEGTSLRYFFTTAPNSPDRRLSIVSGGDSRNHRDARQDANIMVAKLRPHCVMFGGDFTENDFPKEWQEWFDDWQLSIAEDGRVTPIIVTRGNHEASNRSLVDLFDMQAAGGFYATSLGGDLVRIYTLNTLIPVGGEQRDWLENDLRNHGSKAHWRIGQYHHPMRPHTARKSEKNDQVAHWAPLFLKYDVNLMVECDAHVVKSTWPIRPYNGPGSDEGFVRDDENGTVYIGEGCWGAPLRSNDDDKNWTRASGSFNQFNWIFIDKEKIEIRTIQTDGAGRVGSVDPKNIFKAPIGIHIWSPPAGDVITITSKQMALPAFEQDVLASRGGAQGEPSAGAKTAPAPKSPGSVNQTGVAVVEEETGNWEACPLIVADATTGEAQIKYNVEESCNVVIRVINPKLQEVTRIELTNQTPKEYLKTLKISHLPPGKYLAIVKGDRKVLRRYRLVKK
ncbi:MAG: metallophosphoesterase family protein [Saprospiraceae bacterium]|nr:metallophosphoesterase family protein [Saprospiraceae bacterium]